MTRRQRRRLTVADTRLLALSIWTTAVVRLGLWVLPFRMVRTGVGRLAAPRMASDNRAGLDHVVWAVMVASRFVPGASCLTQSLAAQILLARRGYPAQLHVGVAREAGQFDAHAWVESDGRVVIGHADLDRYTPLFNTADR